MEPKDPDYIKWLKEREIVAERLGVKVDNGRPNIIKIAMDELLKNNFGYFNLGKIKDYEAALWMSKNIPTLYATHNRRVLIDILNDEIKFLDAVSNGNETNDNKERPTVEEMKKMIEILKKLPRPDGGRRRTKYSKKHRKSKKSRKSRMKV